MKDDDIALVERFKLLAQKRSAEFAENTLEMLIAAEAALNGLNEFFQSVPVFEGTSIEWVQIVYEPDAPPSDTITLTGVLSYNPGSTFHPPGRSPIKVTDENADYFTRSISISLPLELVTIATKQDVIDYLEYRVEENHPDILGVKPKAPIEESEQSQQPELPISGDKEPLTEKQMKAMLLSAKNPTGVTH